MARYDVFPNPVGAGFLLDVQSDLLDDLNTRVVVPLLPDSKKVKVVRKLNPVFSIDGKEYAMFTHLMASVPSSRLTGPRTNLLDRHDEIIEALDMLFQGF